MFLITSTSIYVFLVFLAESYQIIISQVPEKTLYHTERIPVDISSEQKIHYDKCFCNKVIMTCNVPQ